MYYLDSDFVSYWHEDFCAMWALIGAIASGRDVSINDLTLI